MVGTSSPGRFLLLFHNSYLLSIYSVLCTVLSVGDTAVMKTDSPKISSLQKIKIHVQGEDKDKEKEGSGDYPFRQHHQWAFRQGRAKSTPPLRTRIASLRASEQNFSSVPLSLSVTEAQRRNAFVTLREQGHHRADVTDSAPASPSPFVVPSSRGQRGSLSSLGG